MINYQKFEFYKSPIGYLKILVNDLDEIIEINILTSEEINQNSNIKSGSKEIKRCITQLDEYFSGNRKNFDLKISLAESNGTDFQKRAWQMISEIPYGSTISYQEQAERVGNIKAVRAIGGANGKNPIPIVIPCHRVIGKNGKLVGFSGGDGISTKQWLLDFEKKSM